MFERIENVTCEDGYPLTYRVWPASVAPVATVVLVHGMISHSAWFRNLARYLTGLRFKVVGADRRGSGLNRLQRGDAPSMPMLVGDLRRILEKEIRDAPGYVVGWCWGALPAVNLALQYGDDIAGLALLAPGLFPSHQVRLAAAKWLSNCSNDPSVAALPSPVSDDMFSNRAEVSEFIRNDVDAQRLFTPRFCQVAREMSVTALTRLPQLRKPILLILADNDMTVDNQHTLEYFLRLRRMKVTSVTLSCSHAMHLEIPQVVASTFREWATTQEQAAAPHQVGF